MVRWICGDLDGSRLTSPADGEGSRMNERRLISYGLGIRTAMAAPLSTSPTRAQPAEGEGHRPSAARPLSIESWPGRQVFPEDSALTWRREASGPAHPNPNKRMKSKPARIKRSFPSDNRYLTCRSGQRESVGRVGTSEEAIPTGGCSHHGPCRGGRRHARTDRSCRHDFYRVPGNALAGAQRPGDLALALSGDPGWGHSVAAA